MKLIFSLPKNRLQLKLATKREVMLINSINPEPNLHKDEYEPRYKSVDFHSLTTHFIKKPQRK